MSGQGTFPRLLIGLAGTVGARCSCCPVGGDELGKGLQVHRPCPGEPRGSLQQVLAGAARRVQRLRLECFFPEALDQGLENHPDGQGR